MPEQHYIDEIDGVFFTDRTAATDEEFRARVAPFESAPELAEVREAAVVEEVARALAAADGVLWNSLSEKIGTCDVYRKRAAAAVAAVRESEEKGARK